MSLDDTDSEMPRVWALGDATLSATVSESVIDLVRVFCCASESVAMTASAVVRGLPMLGVLSESAEDAESGTERDAESWRAATSDDDAASAADLGRDASLDAVSEVCAVSESGRVWTLGLATTSKAVMTSVMLRARVPC